LCISWVFLTYKLRQEFLCIVVTVIQYNSSVLPNIGLIFTVIQYNGSVPAFLFDPLSQPQISFAPSGWYANYWLVRFYTCCKALVQLKIARRSWISNYVVVLKTKRNRPKTLIARNIATEKVFSSEIFVCCWDDSSKILTSVALSSVALSVHSILGSASAMILLV